VQTKSRAERENYKVNFDFDKNSYWYVVEKDGQNIISKKYKIPESLNLENEADEEICFYPDRKTSGELNIKVKDSKEKHAFIVKKKEGISHIIVIEIEPE